MIIVGELKFKKIELLIKKKVASSELEIFNIYLLMKTKREKNM